MLFFYKKSQVLKRFLFIALILFFAVSGNLYSQDHPGTGTIAPCGGCAPVGWVNDSGSPDVSSKDGWGLDGTAWSKPVSDPPNGEAAWLSAHTGETSSMNITGLTVGASYTLEFYYMSVKGTSGLGFTNFCSELNYKIDNNAIVKLNIAAEATWYKENVVFTAASTTTKFTFIGGLQSGFGGEMTHISFRPNGTVPTPPDCTTPTVTITPQSSTICSGESVTLTASGADSTYFWPTENFYGASLTLTPADTTVISVKGFNKGGCSSTGTAFVIVNFPPDILVNSAAICPGETTTLTASGADTYTWTPTTNLSASTGASVDANPSVETSYTVTGTLAGCTSSAVSTVSMSSLTPSNTGADITLCTGQTGNLGAAPNGSDIYSWSPATDLSDASIANPTVTITNATSAAVVYTYTLTTNPGPCASTGTVNVTVNPIEDASFNYNPSTVCKAGGSDPSPTVNTAGGVFSCTDGALDLNTTSGIINLGASPVGTYTVSYATSGNCADTKTTVISIVDVPAATFSYAGPYCQSESNPSPILDAGSSFGTFSESTGMLSFVGTQGQVDLTGSSPGTYTVVNEIAASGSCPAAQANSTITINAAPATAITSTVTCEGVSATLTASGADQYLWSDGLTSTASYTVANPSSDMSYTVTGTSNNCSTAAVGTLTVNSNPSITVNSETICEGESATLTPSGADAYSWLDGTSGSSRTENPTSDISYSVTGTSNGCTSSAVVASITVNAAPVVGINTQNICSGQDATITATGASTYVWSDAPAEGNPRTVSPSGSTTYTVTGAIGTCTATATGEVVVSSGSSLSVEPKTICSGTSTTLTAMGGASYTWSNGDLTNTTTVSPTSTQSYTVTDNSVAGCPAIATVTVTVSPAVNVTIEAPSPVCEGESTSLTASGAENYSWSNGSNAASTTVTPTLPSSSYTVTGSTNGCTGTATATVVMSPKPVLTVLPDSACPGGTVSLSVSSSPGVTFLWSDGQSGNTISKSPLESTFYNVTGTYLGCTQTAVVKAHIHQNPTAAFDKPGIYSISDANITFIDKSKNAASWMWSFGDSAMDTVVTEQNPTHQYADTGSYVIRLAVMSPEGCVDTAEHNLEIQPDQFFYIPNSFSPDENNLNEGFGAKGIGVLPDGFIMRIFDRWGQLVFTTNDMDDYWDGKYNDVDAPIDTYVYQFIIKFYNNKEKTYLGWVSLKR